jgi:hypothetical protein
MLLKNKKNKNSEKLTQKASKKTHLVLVLGRPSFVPLNQFGKWA